MMELKIREVRPSDTEDLEELGRKSWIQGQESFLTSEEVEVARQSSEFHKSEEDIRKRTEKDGTFVLVAEKDGKVVGRIRMAWNGEADSFVDEDEVQLRSMFVHPDYWRQGVGTALAEEAFARIPEGFSSFVVEVFEDNENAVNFYRSLGFETAGESVLGPEDIDILSRERSSLIMRK
ncbi:GNAT family N-acetyltransferase [Candidatus Nanohaloarchaea archaeon]|nr:GNAT family N-acetyltransferase [Candidatus Nanohaloarchaea archaeon]